MFAEYTVASISPSSPASSSVFSPVRVVAFLCMTGVLLLHGLHIPSGLRLQNFLGSLKIGILCIVVCAGFLALGGNLQEGVERPGNFDSWDKMWEGSKSGRNVLCACLYNVRQHQNLFGFSLIEQVISRSFGLISASVMPTILYPRCVTRHRR